MAYSSNKPLAALEYLTSNRVDILVTDIRMPIMTGLELAKNALNAYPELKVVFVSGYEDFHYARQALHLKAGGYLLKPLDDDEVLETLRTVVAGLDASRQGRERASNRILDSFGFIKSDFLMHVMEGSIDRATVNAFLEQYPVVHPGRPLAAVIVEIDSTGSPEGLARDAGS
nr:response regulator [Paenibacillus thermoaerophilus]